MGNFPCRCWVTRQFFLFSCWMFIVNFNIRHTSLVVRFYRHHSTIPMMIKLRTWGHSEWEEMQKSEAPQWRYPCFLWFFCVISMSSRPASPTSNEKTRCREKHGLITFHRRIVPTGGQTHAPDFLAEGSNLDRGTNGRASQYTQVTSIVI